MQLTTKPLRLKVNAQTAFPLEYLFVLSNQGPDIIPHHGLIPSSLIPLLHHLNILMKTFTMLVAHVR